jgi:hypothetical protein
VLRHPKTTGTTAYGSGAAEAASQDLRQRYAFLAKDEDPDRGNEGMTLVEFPADTSRIFR